MQFALILLLVLAAACAFGSFITQGQTLSWYTTAYGERAAAAISAADAPITSTVGRMLFGSSFFSSVP